MNPKENPDPFAEELALFSRKSPPPAWKDELINSVADSSHPHRKPRSIVRLSVFGVVAACWIAIGFFYLQTPQAPRENEFSRNVKLSPDTLQLLAGRIQTRGLNF